jgi:hypothetical protein
MTKGNPHDYKLPGGCKDYKDYTESLVSELSMHDQFCCFLSGSAGSEFALFRSFYVGDVVKKGYKYPPTNSIS